jgi:hypothetical protein
MNDRQWRGNDRSYIGSKQNMKNINLRDQQANIMWVDGWLDESERQSIGQAFGTGVLQAHGEQRPCEDHT